MPSRTRGLSSDIGYAVVTQRLVNEKLAEIGEICLVDRGGDCSSDHILFAKLGMIVFLTYLYHRIYTYSIRPL